MLSKENTGAVMVGRNYYKTLNMFNNNEIFVLCFYAFMMLDVVRADARNTMYPSSFRHLIFSAEV